MKCMKILQHKAPGKPSGYGMKFNLCVQHPHVFATHRSIWCFAPSFFLVSLIPLSLLACVGEWMFVGLLLRPKYKIFKKRRIIQAWSGFTFTKWCVIYCKLHLMHSQFCNFINFQFFQPRFIFFSLIHTLEAWFSCKISTFTIIFH